MEPTRPKTKIDLFFVGESAKKIIDHMEYWQGVTKDWRDDRILMMARQLLEAIEVRKIQIREE